MVIGPIFRQPEAQCCSTESDKTCEKVCVQLFTEVSTSETAVLGGCGDILCIATYSVFTFPVLFLTVPNVELPALCSSQFKSGPPSDLAQTSSVFIYDLVMAYVLSFSLASIEQFHHKSPCSADD